MDRTVKIIDQIFDIKQETMNSFQDEKNSFSYLNNEGQIRGLSWFLPTQEKEKINYLFLRLSEYFEIGLLLASSSATSNSHISRNSGNIFWQLEKSFIFKKIIDQNEINTKQIILPHFEDFKIYKKKGSPLDKLGLNILVDSDFTTIFYKVNQNSLFCFITKQAEPWLSLRLEKIMKELRNGLV